MDAAELRRRNAAATAASQPGPAADDPFNECMAPICLNPSWIGMPEQFCSTACRDACEPSSNPSDREKDAKIA